MEFTVIDAEVIQSRLGPQQTTATGKSSNDPDRLLIALKQVQQLDLSCMNILHIVNLSVLSSSNLTSLKLSLNRIDKLCHLDTLTNLVELDLSHNRISRIENIQHLTRLQRLSLNHNPITRVENLEGQLDSLAMLDVGYCKIEDLKYTLYLKQFTNLVSLVAEGNPIHFKPAGADRSLSMTIIQSLLVYDNKTIRPEERVKARHDYRKLVELLEKSHRKWKLKAEADGERATRSLARKEAFLDGILEGDDVDLNERIFRNATVESVLRENNRYGIHNAYRMHSEKFKTLVSDITTAAESCRATRTGLVQTFGENLRQLVDERVEESRRYVLKFIGDQKKYFANRCPMPSDVNDSTVGLESIMHKLWLALMCQEDRLSSRICAMIADLHGVLEKEIDRFKRFVKDRFGSLQTQQNDFLQFILEYATSFAQNNEAINRQRKVSEITDDISQCMEQQTLLIGQAESSITTKSSEWLNTLCKDLKSREVHRNRQKVLEIAAFVQFQKTRWNDKTKNMNIPF
ncbi:uncharacterized protein LOC126836788 [Adelges cooleyi]|uniref:uncharacterized protein LOC126836788 n=1 Tax=Adelges cooleyi TaxID=133065 RepID=UPI00217F7C03|nr:uncharacterized protein LOC126836788 [Adelges cooleyi]